MQRTVGGSQDLKVEVQYTPDRNNGYLLAKCIEDVPSRGCMIFWLLIVGGIDLHRHGWMNANQEAIVGIQKDVKVLVQSAHLGPQGRRSVPTSTLREAIDMP